MPCSSGRFLRVVRDGPVRRLITVILASGETVLADEYYMVYFPGDSLLDRLRPRGLPIGNLTSQFWSNCYLNPLDWFVTRELGCDAYVRYVDDFALFADSKHQALAMESAHHLLPGRPAPDRARQQRAGQPRPRAAFPGWASWSTRHTAG